MQSADDSTWTNTSGYSTSLALDIGVLNLVVYAGEMLADKTEWDSDNQVFAATAYSKGPSTRLALALRSNTFLKGLWSDIVRNASTVGDKASNLLQ